MSWTDDSLYQRLPVRDGSYDGRFVVGVFSTGIYCLPSCTARKPKRENVRFFRRPEEAEAAGLRACLRCRPELFYRGEDWDRSLFEGLLARLRADPGAFHDIGSLAAACGVSGTKLNELVREHAHLTPAMLLRRERVRAAGARLLAGRERVIEVGYAVGFEAESTFHRHFLGLTGMAPAAYRGLRESAGFLLQLPRGYRAGDPLSYHGRDPEGPAERIRDGQAILKPVRLPGAPAAVLEIAFEPEGAWCQVHGLDRPGRDVMAAAHATAVRLLGIGSDTAGLEGRAGRDPLVARLVEGRRGLRVPLAATPFEALTWAIVGQQINVRFAVSLRRALVELAGRAVPGGGGLLVHPTPEAVAALEPAELTKLRFSRSKAEYLVGMARRVADGSLPLDALGQGSAQAAEAALKAVRGLGPWTARYTLLRGFGFADCAPVGDSGLGTGLQRFLGLAERPDAKETDRLMAAFAPHRSLATCHLWASLNEVEEG
ncbi:MAG TPA: Ada metal-binding domain-containing protein [Thermoanaerobaculia bacterium]|jgi:AraC family transcriptional regulator of adaptative response / DNA-3-methyladenine glycosylase II|nr:Ada metal-binding domain-containing protein [Thermoanaerobaculia bacterium]